MSEWVQKQNFSKNEQKKFWNRPNSKESLSCNFEKAGKMRNFLIVFAVTVSLAQSTLLRSTSPDSVTVAQGDKLSLFCESDDPYDYCQWEHVDQQVYHWSNFLMIQPGKYSLIQLKLLHAQKHTFSPTQNWESFEGCRTVFLNLFWFGAPLLSYVNIWRHPWLVKLV